MERRVLVMNDPSETKYNSEIHDFLIRLRLIKVRENLEDGMACSVYPITLDEYNEVIRFTKNFLPESQAKIAIPDKK